MTVLLSLVFFASGAAALLFETLWFRQAGLMLGNSVWATSLVTSSFMGGLAIGNAWAGRRGDRWARPLRVYAALEAAIGVTGISLVLILPRLTEFLAPVFTPLAEHPAPLNFVRFGVAFALLLLPASAMGATLPSLTLALSGPGRPFGRVLGILYGANTLGAVAGALGGEMFLIERLGMRGTGEFALAINLFAVAAAWLLSGRVDAPSSQVQPEGSAPGSAAPFERRLLFAAFLSGAILLALEVIWFRLLILLVYGTTRAFAVMLAVVLLGIGLGGLLAGALTRNDQRAARFLPATALLAGAVTAWAYSPLADALGFAKAGRFPNEFALLFTFAATLMLPTSILSGVLFTLLGSAIKSSHSSSARAAGALTLANTVGAMLGPLLATFLLLPRLGMEKSIFLLASLYGAVALCVRREDDPSGPPPSFLLKAGSVFGLLAFVSLLALFPFGLMVQRYARSPIDGFLAEGQVVAAYREGLTETVTYLVRAHWGRPVAYRLVTDSHSMSGTEYGSLRYMRYFVYLPVALHPDAETALQISYGVGTTAKALSETRGLRRIDLVDISRDILDLGRVVFPKPGTLPLDDPRFRVHVEDGRFFLLTTDRRFDIITAEPPPPKGAGIVNLYSREFFALAKSRLNPGGLLSYWFPVYQASAEETKSMMKAFCDVFEDCTLWTGYGLEWMMVGSNGFKGPTSLDAFSRQWKDDVVAGQLKLLGFERPEMFGATFLADAPQLREALGGARPLDDDHPLRISAKIGKVAGPFYLGMMDVDRARRAFESSEWIREHWPAELRERTLPAFAEQGLANLGDMPPFGLPSPGLAQIEQALVTSERRAPIVTLLRLPEPDIEAARTAFAAGVRDSYLETVLAADALGDRDYARAAEHYAEADRLDGQSKEPAPQWILTLALAGRNDEARRLFARVTSTDNPALASDWAWLKERISR